MTARERMTRRLEDIAIQCLKAIDASSVRNEDSVSPLDDLLADIEADLMAATQMAEEATAEESA